MNQKTFFQRLVDLTDEATISDVNVELLSVRLHFHPNIGMTLDQALAEKLHAAGVPENIVEHIKKFGLDRSIMEHVRAGKKIDAIKAWRAIYNSGLAEAKNAVEAL